MTVYGDRGSVRSAAEKCLDLTMLLQKLALHSPHQRRVFTNGCFDLLHAGHLASLEFARRQGDLLIVGINSDASVRMLKGVSRPLQPEQERALLVAGFECVDYTVIFPETTPLHLLEQIRPAVYVKGGDYSIDELPETPLVRSWGGEVRLSPLVAERSTTALLQRNCGEIS